MESAFQGFRHCGSFGDILAVPIDGFRKLREIGHGIDRPPGVIVEPRRETVRISRAQESRAGAVGTIDEDDRKKRRLVKPGSPKRRHWSAEHKEIRRRLRG